MTQAQGTQQKSLVKKLLIILVVVVVVGGAALFLFSRPSAPPPDVPQETATLSEPDFSVFESEGFGRFKVWSVIPVTPGQTGKDNPFGQ